MQTLYDDLKAAELPLDSHESDLYVLASDQAREIIEYHGWSFSAFQSQIDGRTWYDCPFAFLPFWEAKS